MPLVKFDRLPGGEELIEFPPSYTARYLAVGEEDMSLVEAAALLLTPLSLITNSGATIFRQPLQTTRKGFGIYEVEVPYARKKWGPFEITISGRSTGGGTVKIKGSLETIATSAGAPDFQGLIGYNPTDQTVEGTDVEEPISEISINFKAPPGFVNLAYMDSLTQLKGVVNNLPWLIWRAGEVRFDGAEYTDGTYTDTDVTLNVSIQKNLPASTIAGLSVDAKDGWDFLWFLTKEENVAGPPPYVITRAEHWYIERTRLRANFGAILGFGGSP